MAGIVVEVGSAVTGCAVGDRVMAMTGASWAEQVVVPAALAMPVPENFGWHAAAATPVSFVTAYDALTRAAELRPSETVLVQGATSAVGLAALQLVRASRAGAVVGTSTSPWKLDRLHDMGFAAFRAGSRDLLDFVNGASAGRGVDVVIDVVGGPALSNNVELASVQARIVCVGRVGGTEGVLNMDEFARKRLIMIGVTFRTRSMAERVAAVRAFTADALPMLADGSVCPILDRVFPLERIEDAEAYMKAGETFGKIVIDVASSSAE